MSAALSIIHPAQPVIAENHGDPCGCADYYLARWPDLGDQATSSHTGHCANEFRMGMLDRPKMKKR